MDKTIIELSKNEVIFLATLIGANEFLGIENDMFSLTQEQIKKEWENIQISLEEKQFIEVGFDGSVLIDELIHGLLITCTNCQSYIYQNRRDDDKNILETHYYISEYIAVKMEEVKDKNQFLSFEFLLTTTSLKDKIIENLMLEKLPQNYNQAVSILETVVEQVKSSIINKDNYQATQILSNEGVDDNFSQELIKLLTNPTSYNSLLMMVFGKENSGEVFESIIIQSENQIWLCKLNVINDDTSSFNFIPQSYDGTIKAIYELIKPIDSIYQYGKEVLAV